MSCCIYSLSLHNRHSRFLLVWRYDMTKVRSQDVLYPRRVRWRIEVVGSFIGEMLEPQKMQALKTGDARDKELTCGRNAWTERHDRNKRLLSFPNPKAYRQSFRELRKVLVKVPGVLGLGVLHQGDVPIQIKCFQSSGGWDSADGPSKCLHLRIKKYITRMICCCKYWFAWIAVIAVRSMYRAVHGFLPPWRSWGTLTWQIGEAKTRIQLHWARD